MLELCAVQGPTTRRDHCLTPALLSLSMPMPELLNWLGIL